MADELFEEQVVDGTRFRPTPEAQADEAAQERFSLTWSYIVPVRRNLLSYLVNDKPNPRLREGDRTLTFWWAGSKWKGCIRCKDASCVAFFTADSLPELFEEMESRLKKGEAVWKVEKRLNRKRSDGASGPE